MAAGSAQRAGAEAFTTPTQVNHRRYEALRAYFVEGLTHAEAGRRFGYTRWAMIDLVRQHRAGKLDLFTAPRKPGPPPGTAPAKDRVRGRVIELRRQGLSTYEISARLATEHTPLNRTSVGEILTEEGFGRLLRHPEPAASINPATPGRDTRLPRTAKLDFASWPATLDTGKAGLLLLIPDLVALDLPELVTRAGYPATQVVPAISWLLSLLALKLTRTRRVSHVDDLLLSDPAAALFAGLSVLPKKSALTDYSYRTGHDHQRQFLAALDEQMIDAGLATGEDAIFDLDFHAVMHRGHDPVLEKHYVPTRSQRARSVLTFFAQDTGTHNLVYANADLTKATQAREVIAFCDHWKTVSGTDPRMLIMDQKLTTHAVLGELDDRGVKFLTLRMRSPALRKHIDALTATDFKSSDPGPARKVQSPQSLRDHRRAPDQLPRRRAATRGHRPRARRPHRPDHQRPRPPGQSPDHPLRPADDHRTTPRRDHRRLPRRRPVLHGQPQRRPRHHALRARPSPARRTAHPAARLRHRHPRRAATPLPRNPRHDHHQRRHHHRPPRPTRLQPHPAPSRPPTRHHRPLVGKPHPTLRNQLTPVASN
ncbi:MAG TPA: hypothetical protein VIW24_21525 [Aldersonia sp.]